MVAPPSEAGVPEVLRSFFPAPPMPDARLVCSDNDPYCPEGAVSLYGEGDVLPGQGHINPDAGYGPWPAVEAWARDGIIPLRPRPAP
jgi:predicted alpha/beta hydrolase family esterase